MVKIQALRQNDKKKQKQAQEQADKGTAKEVSK